MIKLIIVGGFLGAGKTTLLWQTAKHFINQGKTVGIITNDQAPELVDSSLLRHAGLSVAEVSGSCFCCDFSGFQDAIMRLKNLDVIIAEPVGSCADLSATILQPLKKLLSDEVQLMPFTVLADAQRLPSILDGGTGGLHPDAAYIFRKQMEESDILQLTKTDLLTEAQQTALTEKMAAQFPSSTVMSVSALKDEGIDDWLAALEERKSVGKKLLVIDYDKYAHGEAVLGWLNGTLRLSGTATDWNALLRQFIEALQSSLRRQSAPIGHLKAIIESTSADLATGSEAPATASSYAVANLTDLSATPSFRGDAGHSPVAVLTINARVETTPDALDQLVKTELKNLLADKFQQEVIAWKSLQPGRPNPTYRFAEVI